MKVWALPCTRLNQGQVCDLKGSVRSAEVLTAVMCVKMLPGGQPHLLDSEKQLLTLNASCARSSRHHAFHMLKSSLCDHWWHRKGVC